MAYHGSYLDDFLLYPKKGLIRPVLSFQVSFREDFRCECVVDAIWAQGIEMSEQDGHTLS